MSECPNIQRNPPEIEAQFPPGTQPESRIMPETPCLPALSALRSFGYTPLLVTGTLRQLLLQHFADPDHIQNGRLRKYLEDAGVWQTPGQIALVIESAARWMPEKAGVRPAILLKEGNWEYNQMLIGNLAWVEADTGEEVSLGMWRGTHTILVIGVDAAETQVLATEIAKLLVWFAKTIANALELHDFRLVQIGETHALQESREHYVVPLQLTYAAEERWSVHRDAPRTQKIQLSPTGILGVPVGM